MKERPRNIGSVTPLGDHALMTWRLQKSDLLPDARDGLTRVERIVLWQLREAQKEFADRNVPTATLYGRVVEHISLSVGAFQKVLQRLVGAPHNTSRIDDAGVAGSGEVRFRVPR